MISRPCGLLIVVVVGALSACNRPVARDHVPAARVAQAEPTVSGAVAIAHGGVGSSPDSSDGPRRAVDAALAALEAGADPVDAAVAGVVILEDDPRFNAGTGSRVRIDGATIQMDAAVMDSEGHFGAVAIIEQVRYPVVVARAVLDTPHLLLAGDGATRFAHDALKMPPYEPATAESLERATRVQQLLRARHPDLPPAWRGFDWRRAWNFQRTLQEAGMSAHEVGGDTVGVAVRAEDGRYAVALSTGGTSVTLRGRVGDVPVLGAGLYAGALGAVAATGTGERIVEAGLARAVYRRLEAGASPQHAADHAVELLRGRGSVGVIVIGADRFAAAADQPMAWAARALGASVWFGPEPRAGSGTIGDKP